MMEHFNCSLKKFSTNLFLVQYYGGKLKFKSDHLAQQTI